MSRTGLDAATLARSLRTAAGDGSIEWVNQPIQASVLLDVADMLDENKKLRELVKDIDEVADPFLWEFIGRRMRALGIEVKQ
jgi:hypothetical protein